MDSIRIRTAAHTFTACLIGTLLATGLFGCLGSETIDISASCTVAKDQRGSFMPQMDPTSVQISIDSRFSSAQQLDILKAVSIWNGYGRNLTGQPFFRTTVASAPAESSPVGKNECEFAGADDGGFWILLEDSASRWQSLNLTARNGGATVRCTQNGTLNKQVVMINPKNGDPAQFMSVILHELGHTIGLGHSCLQDAGRVDYASCSSLSDDHPYRVAVMNPILMVYNSGSPEIKETLRTNDIERAACLYQK